jgi:hypothetical protein
VTIAIGIKINDGLVLAADSASTLIGDNGDVQFVYNHADKVFNLRKGLPIGCIFWGAGGIGNTSISTLLKDLRKRFAGQEPDWAEWEINPRSYTVEEIARRVREFLFLENYEPTFAGSTAKPDFGIYIAGYSSGQTLGEMHLIAIQESGKCEDPVLVTDPDQPAILAGGQADAVYRLVRGFGLAVETVLGEQPFLTPEQQIALLAALTERLGVPVLTAAMPIQDAIDLAEFLADVSVKYSRFTPGAATIGGPIEVAAITKHEGFKWIKRKYYYSRELNPEEQDAPQP